MVNYLLGITGELENLTDLQPQGGCDDPDFTYCIKLKCGNCGELSEKESWVSLNETVSVPKSRGTANLVQKCKFCGRDGTVSMIGGRGRPLTQEHSEAGMYTPLMLFDCRGFEPVDFVFGGGWKVESVEGTKFDAVDLSGGEFAEYDEKGECPVMISNLRSRFEVVK
ncbi:CXXC motif containing zinc binding protein, eukaryotic [Dillenia turbinata]|uniref:CXXC motif containing zinc binding protein, eukaryotic n=1 Tax=Dillenia turbinata TaxID=194707 RepID=A0AAN8ULV4_9MAGN